MVTQIYVDGSVSRYGSAYAIVIRGTDNIKRNRRKVLKVLNEDLRSIYKVELLAVLNGLKMIQEYSISKKCSHTIYTDSLQVWREIKCLQKPSDESTVLEIQKLLDTYNFDLAKIDRKDNIAGVWLDKRLHLLNRKYKW